jgi:hypothetical protein
METNAEEILNTEYVRKCVERLVSRAEHCNLQ